MKSDCVVSIVFPDLKRLDAALAAISHEGGLSERSSAKTAVDRESRRLTLTIDAQDVVAMRATFNAYMRAFQVFEAVQAKEGAAD
jgi:tRNA threonylcarbamoyladenosine modification (KEOPS) complex  Pcc1 subunit